MAWKAALIAPKKRFNAELRLTTLIYEFTRECRAIRVAREKRRDELLNGESSTASKEGQIVIEQW